MSDTSKIAGMTPVFEVTIPFAVDYDTLTNIVITAFEGGSNYWMQDYNYSKVGEPNPELHYYEEYTDWRTNEVKPWYYIYGVNEGLKIEFYDRDGLTLTGYVDQARLKFAIEKAVGVYMSTGNWKWLVDQIRSNDIDGDGADVLFQLALFGEVVYG